ELSDPSCFTGTGQTVSTAPGGEVVYEFHAPTSGEYSFRATGFSPASNLVLWVAGSCPPATPGTPVTVGSCLGAANRTVNAANSYSANTAEEVSCLPLAAGQNVFVFVDDGAAADAGSAFHLEATRCGRETEPNGTPATAGPLACGIKGAIAPAGDADFYALGAPAAGSRVFALTDGVAANQ